MNFFEKYFINPIINNTYSTINTIVYVGLLLGFYFGVLIPYLKKRVKIDFSLFLSFIPYIIIGALLRVAEEPYSAINLVEKTTSPFTLGFWFITPGIYIALFLLGFLIFHIFYKLRKNQVLIYFGCFGGLFALGLLIAYLIMLTQPLNFFITLIAIIVVFGLIYHNNILL